MGQFAYVWQWFFAIDRSSGSVKKDKSSHSIRVVEMARRSRREAVVSIPICE